MSLAAFPAFASEGCAVVGTSCHSTGLLLLLPSNLWVPEPAFRVAPRGLMAVQLAQLPACTDRRFIIMRHSISTRFLMCDAAMMVFTGSSNFVWGEENSVSRFCCAALLTFTRFLR